MTRKQTNPTPSLVGPQRLQRVMAAAGIGSRRECEVIIEEGRVEVDGQVVTQLGVKVEPEKQKIFVDGEALVIEPLQYFMLNKPPGVVSTSRDPSGRARVIDLIQTDKRVYNVGRLDQSSEGLILVTNDGELANRLTHPRYGIQKKYHVQVVGVPAPSDLRDLEKGVYLAEGKAKATSAKFLRKVKNTSWIEIVLAEGRNREIRRMLASIGNKVRTLKRVAIGPLKLGDLPVGAHRQLTTYELKSLQRAVAGELTERRPKKKVGKKKSALHKKDRPAAGKAAKFKPGKKAGGKESSVKKDSSVKKSSSRKARPAKSSSKKRPVGKAVNSKRRSRK